MGKTFLVVGANRGIGGAIAQHFFCSLLSTGGHQSKAAYQY
ncbi:MAG: hypothetical protein AAFQ63_20905 [Cyanobacteria bacterium J06621_11]